MDLESLKTIDLDFYEWFDKINGNSYFAGEIILNFSLENEEIIKVPFSYGYDSAYEFKSFKIIKELFKIDKKNYPFWDFCKDNNIIKRSNKTKNCLKRDLKEFD